MTHTQKIIQDAIDAGYKTVFDAKNLAESNLLISQFF